jgi:hypothetical protein
MESKIGLRGYWMSSENIEILNFCDIIKDYKLTIKDLGLFIRLLAFMNVPIIEYPDASEIEDVDMSDYKIEEIQLEYGEA